MPAVYKGLKLDCGYRAHLVVADSVVVEIKGVERLAPVHEAQFANSLAARRLEGGSSDQLQRTITPGWVVRRVFRLDETRPSDSPNR